MADTGGRHQVQHAVEQAVTGAQDGNQAEFPAVDPGACHGLQRCVDFDLFDLKIAADLIGQQLADFAQPAAE